MAQTITRANVVSVLASGSTPTIFVDYTVRVAIASAIAFQATGTLVDSVPAAETAYVATCLARLTPG